MLNRLSGPSLRLRVGLGVAMLAGGVTSLFFGWGWIAGAVALVSGSYAAYKTPSVAAYVMKSN
jgi:hypothetical protein